MASPLDAGRHRRKYVTEHGERKRYIDFLRSLTAAFHFDFGALDNSKNEVSEAYDNLFADSQLHPRLWMILFRASWKWLPHRLLNLVGYIPTREYKRFRHTRKVVDKVSTVLVENAIEEAKSVEIEKGRKDVMSVLGESLRSLFVTGLQCANAAVQFAPTFRRIRLCNFQRPKW